MHKIFSLILISLLGICLPYSSYAKDADNYQLKNGLKLLVKTVPRANVVVAMIWYKVGSADEPGGITGISHVLEHMMFKGTPNYAPNAYSKIIARNGGQENAFTNRDYTAYFAKITADKLPIFLKLEADRLQNLTLAKKEFAKEINVVKEERRMRTDDNPKALTYERFLATAHLASPYHRPIIGWMNDLNNMTVSDLKKWYDTYYTPNNATVVIVGDISGQKAFQLVKQYFSGIKSKPLPKRKPELEPNVLGKRRVNIQLPAKLPFLVVGFNVPSRMTAKNPEDAYALEVLAGVLDGGNSARLETTLIRGQHLATQVSADYSLYSRYDTLFVIYAIPSQKTTLAGLEAALVREITKLQTETVTKGELQRIKNQVIAANVFSKDSLFGQAMELGLLETIGIGHKERDNYIKNINAVTAEDLQRVAKKYLIAKRMTVATLTPDISPRS